MNTIGTLDATGERIVVVTDAQTGEMVAVGPGVERLTGLPAADITRRALAWLVHPADRSAVRDHHDRLRHSVRGELTCRIRHAAQEWAPHRVSSVMAADRRTATHRFAPLAATTPADRAAPAAQELVDRLLADPTAYLALVTSSGVEVIDLVRSTAGRPCR